MQSNPMPGLEREERRDEGSLAERRPETLQLNKMREMFRLTRNSDISTGHKRVSDSIKLPLVSLITIILMQRIKSMSERENRTAQTLYLQTTHSSKSIF